MSKKWITVNFYPNLSHHFGETHTVWARNPAQAIGIIARKVGLQKWESYFIEASKRGERYQIVYGGKLLSEQELTKSGTAKQIYIVPVIEGASFEAIGSIWVGSALIAAAVIGSVSGIPANIFISLGASLVLGGIQQLFAPNSDNADQQNPESFGFGSVPDFGKLGTTIPVLYGEMIIKNMIVISAYSKVSTTRRDGITVSETTFRVLYLIGHGRITGFVKNARDSTFFNEQPLSALLDESTNVASPILYNGSQTNPVSNHVTPSLFKESPATARITKDKEFGIGSLSFEISNPFWNVVSSYDPSQNLQNKQLKIGLRFKFVILRIEADDGDRTGHALDYNIKIRETDGAILIDQDLRESAKAPQGYERLRTFTVPAKRQYKITITKTSEDAEIDIEGRGNTARLEDEMSLLSYEVALLSSSSLAVYNGYALLDVEIPAKVFNGQLPSTAVELKGRQCPILQSDGTLKRGSNGNLALKWSNNPANILLDLLTNKEFGLGTLLVSGNNYEDNINIASFKELHDYSDEILADGKKRFEFNAYLTRSSDSLTMLRDIGQTARTTFYNAEGEISAVIDRFRGNYGDSYLVFNDSNVGQKLNSEGNAVATFEYGASELTARKTVINATFFNKNDFYKQDTVWASADGSAQNKYGLNPQTATALGQTSEVYARRFARNILSKELTRNRLVTFRTGAIGLWLNPGRVIQIEDPRVGYVLLYEILKNTEVNQGIEFEVTALIYIPEAYDYVDLGTEQSPPTLNPVDNSLEPISYPQGSYSQSIDYSKFNPEDITQYESEWDATPIEINQTLIVEYVAFEYVPLQDKLLLQSPDSLLLQNSNKLLTQ